MPTCLCYFPAQESWSPKPSFPRQQVQQQELYNSAQRQPQPPGEAHRGDTAPGDRHYQHNYLSALFTLEFKLLLSLADECFQLDTARDKDLPVPNSQRASTTTFNLHHLQCTNGLSFLKAMTRTIKEAVGNTKNILFEIGCIKYTFLVTCVA